MNDRFFGYLITRFQLHSLYTVEKHADYKQQDKARQDNSHS